MPLGFEANKAFILPCWGSTLVPTSLQSLSVGDCEIEVVNGAAQGAMCVCLEVSMETG